LRAPIRKSAGAGTGKQATGRLQRPGISGFPDRYATPEEGRIRAVGGPAASTGRIAPERTGPEPQVRAGSGDEKPPSKSGTPAAPRRGPHSPLEVCCSSTHFWWGRVRSSGLPATEGERRGRGLVLSIDEGPKPRALELNPPPGTSICDDDARHVLPGCSLGGGAEGQLLRDLHPYRSRARRSSMDRRTGRKDRCPGRNICCTECAGGRPGRIRPVTDWRHTSYGNIVAESALETRIGMMSL